MVRFNSVLIFLFSCFGGFACTDAERAKYGSIGSEHSVECYSGGKLIYKGVATGKVLSEETSDGYYFFDKANDKLTEVSADCIIVRL